MNILPIYQTVNSVNYWVGFSAGGADLAGTGVITVGDSILSTIKYFDANGNPQWILNADGSITLNSVVASLQQQIAKTNKDRAVVVTNMLATTIAQAVMAGDSVASWSAIYTAIKAAIKNVT
jgi:hypothetical protein